MNDIIETEYDFNKEINLFLKNIDFLKSLYKEKKLIFVNEEIHCQMMFIRRLFLDWIYANKKSVFSNVVRYSSFKRSFKKYIKKNNVSDNSFIVLWSDFNNFLIRHENYCLDIYDYCMYLYNNHKLSKLMRLFIYSIVCTSLFFKWRKKRNDLVRKWVHYNSRRKKKFNYDFSDANTMIILNEAKSSILLLNPYVKFD